MQNLRYHPRLAESDLIFHRSFPGGSVLKNLSSTQEDPLEEEMATHSGVPAWETPWTEEPGGPQSVESQRVGHV